MVSILDGWPRKLSPHPTACWMRGFKDAEVLYDFDSWPKEQGFGPRRFPSSRVVASELKGLKGQRVRVVLTCLDMEVGPYGSEEDGRLVLVYTLETLRNGAKRNKGILGHKLAGNSAALKTVGAARQAPNLASLLTSPTLNAEVAALSEEAVHTLTQALAKREAPAEEAAPPVEVKEVPPPEPAPSLTTLAAMKAEDIEALASAQQKLGADLLVKLLRWGVAQEQVGEVLESLDSLDADALSAVSTVSGLAVLRQARALWDAYLADPNNVATKEEEHWQREFTRHHFLLEHLFAHPVAIVKAKAYVGGKEINNTGANLLDFLLKSELTGNAVILEIKTPGAHLLGSEYRDGIYDIGHHVTGGVLQALDYRHSFTQEWFSLKAKNANTPAAFEPPCVVIVGNSAQLDSDDKRKSFELFRRQFGGVTVLTFDEVFKRVDKLIELLTKVREAKPPAEPSAARAPAP